MPTTVLFLGSPGACGPPALFNSQPSPGTWVNYKRRRFQRCLSQGIFPQASPAEQRGNEREATSCQRLLPSAALSLEGDGDSPWTGGGPWAPGRGPEPTGSPPVSPRVALGRSRAAGREIWKDQAFEKFKGLKNREKKKPASPGGNLQKSFQDTRTKPQPALPGVTLRGGVPLAPPQGFRSSHGGGPLPLRRHFEATARHLWCRR